jgi:hypothetical protein
MSFDPVTMTWTEDEAAPGPVRVPGSMPPPTFNYGQGGASHGAPPPPPGAPSGPPPAIPPSLSPEPGQPGILQALDVTQQQDSTTVGETAKNEVSGKVVTPDAIAARKEQDAASADLKAAAEARAKAERAAAERDAAKLNTEAAVAQLEAQDAQNVQRERVRLREEGDKYAAARVAEYQSLAAKQDDKFLQDATVGRKVAWGVGLLLGAFGAIKTGRNTAAEMLSDTIDKWDVDRRTKLETSRKAVADAKTWADKRVRDYLDDEIKSAPLKKAGFLLQVATQVEAELAARKGQITAEAEAKAKEAVAKARADAAKLQADYAATYAPTSTAGGTTSATVREGTMVQTGTGDAKARGRQLFRLDGKPAGQALSDPEAEKIRAGQSATKSLNDVLDRFHGNISKEGTWTSSFLEPSATKTREGLVSQAAGFLTQMFQTGVLNQGEYERYKSMMESRFFQSETGAKAVLDEIRSGVNAAYDRRLESQGIDLSRPPPSPGGRTGATPEAPPGQRVKALIEESRGKAAPKGKAAPAEERQKLPSGGYAVKRGGKWVAE